MRRAVLFFLVLISPFAATSSFGEPTKNIHYLMNDPMTIWDWGMHQMQKRTSDIKLSDNSAIFTFVTYDWDKNRIFINCRLHFTKKVGSIEKAKNFCKEAIEAVKWDLGIDPSTGESIVGDNSWLGKFFSHYDVQKTDRPKDIDKELDNITVIKGLFILEDKQKKFVECESPLLSKNIYFAE